MDEATQKEFIRVEKQGLDNHAKNNILSHTVLDKISIVSADVHSIKQNQGKDRLITYAVIAFAFLLIGIEHKQWLPYAADIADTYQEAKKLKGKE
jgi:hypothetical protein